MNKRILLSIFLLASIFCISSLKATNPGTTTIDVETCLYVEIPFGRMVNENTLPDGKLFIYSEKATPFLYTPTALQTTFEFDTHLEIITQNVPPQYSKIVSIVRTNGLRIYYAFLRGQSVGKPIYKNTANLSKLVMQDANGNAVTDNPAYFDRLMENGDVIRYSASTNSVVSITKANGKILLPSDPGIGIEIIRNGNAIRQVRSIADGLADVVTVDDFKYQVNIYAPENVGTKNGQGLYTFSGNPYKSWTIENTMRSTTNIDNIRVTENNNGTTYVDDWKYIEAVNDWRKTSGNALRVDLTTKMWDADQTNCRVTFNTNGSAGIVKKKIVNWHFSPQWGDFSIVSQILDPDSAALETSYTYNQNPLDTGKYAHIITKHNPDGSSESYDYDTQGRMATRMSCFMDSSSAKGEYFTYTPVDSSDVPIANECRPRSVTTKISGTIVSVKYFAYIAANNGYVEIEETGLAPYGDVSNFRKTTTYYPNSSGEASRGRIASIAWPDGKLDTYTYEYGTYPENPDPALCSFTAGTGDVLRQTIVHGTSANPAGVAGKSTKEMKITDGHGNMVMTETYAYDGAGYSRIIWNVKTFDVQHHVLASYDSDGTCSTATWTGGNKSAETISDGTQYTYTYNSLKQMVSKTKVGGPTTVYIYDIEGRQLSETISGGGVSLATSATYDLAGRVTSRTDAAGLVTSYAYSNGGRTVTATLPGGFTEITNKYLDGKIKSVTGTAVVAKYYTYGTNQDGTQWTKVCTAVENGTNYVKTTSDAFGRTISEERPGFTGTLATGHFHNSQGLLIKTTSTGNADNLYAYDDFNNPLRTALDLNSNGQIDLSADDRVSESETSFQSVNGQWWSINTSKVYGDNGAVTTSITKKQLTGLASGTIANTVTTDINGNDTVTTTTLDRTNKTVVQTINTPDSNVDSVSTTVNGLLVSQRTKENFTYNFSYDGIGRKIGDTDPRTGTSVTHYNALGQVDYVQDAAGKQTSFTYESATGRRSSVVNALDKATSYTYNSRGQVLSVRGDASYPLDYVYDSYGRMTQLKTYRNSNLQNPDITTWAYQESTGLLTSKTYADNNSVAYTYSNEGKLATRTWSRGVVTSYSYDLAGDLTGISYSDSTPAVAFTYNRLGQRLNVTDAVGSRTFSYNGVLQWTSEAITGIYNKTINRSYDELGRSSGINIGTEYAISYQYDSMGRFSTLSNDRANPSETFTYSYLANSNLVSSIQYPASISVTKSYEAHRDLVTSVENKYNTTTISKYDYVNDDIGRRTSMGKSGTAFSQFDTISYGYNDRSEVTGAVAQNQSTYSYGFSFDPIGNRITSLSAETGTSVTRTYTSNQLNQYTSIDNPTAAPTYDNDGNTVSCPMSSGNWTMTWDAENRLIVAEKAGQRLEFKYDYASRRVEKRVLYGGTETKKERFVYNRFLQIEQLNAMDGNAIEKKRVWGLGDKIIADISSTGSTLYALGDANKNITDYIDATATIQGHFEYSPSGKISVVAGNDPDSFDIRFSSEYFDSETNLIYYNFRYYLPETGCWLNRDPVEEKGGKNLTAFTQNNSVNGIDYLGQVLDNISPVSSGAWTESVSDTLSSSNGSWFDNTVDTLSPSPIIPIVIDILRRIHYARNGLNNAPDTKKEAIDKGYTNDVSQRYHQQGKGEEGNDKYVSPDGHDEGVYNDNSKVTNSVNQGTYNFADPRTCPLGHILLDMLPYYIWGNTPTDPTNMGDRITGGYTGPIK